tara:strand:+ start:165 stop:266 length:102 start_codon:yes stop_codon:yes gene_type:complete
MNFTKQPLKTKNKNMKPTIKHYVIALVLTALFV